MGFRFIGSHNDELEGGQPIEPGQFIDKLDPELPKNKQLLDDGYLIEADIPHEGDLPDGHPRTLTAIDPREGQNESEEPAPSPAPVTASSSNDDDEEAEV